VARQSEAISLAEAKQRLLAESPVPPVLGDISAIVRRHPVGTLVVAAGVGALIMRSGGLRSMLGPAAGSLLLKLLSEGGIQMAGRATRQDTSRS
jgi:hypothetical protein